MQIMTMVFMSPSKLPWQCVNASNPDPLCRGGGVHVDKPPCDLPRDAWAFACVVDRGKTPQLPARA